MANLFPIGSLESLDIKENKKIEFKGTYAFDFIKGDFIRNPNGSIKVLDEFGAYIQWCEKVMLTARYKYSAYSNKYGKDIIGSNMDRKAIELELKRITSEALLVHPMTKLVDNFTFSWGNAEVYYTYEITTIKGQNKVLTSTMKVG